MAKVEPMNLNKKKMQKSRVLQVSISNVNQAQATFARHESSFGGTPIVLVPNEPRCFSCCLTIPDGFWVLCQKWYEDKGAHPAGYVPPSLKIRFLHAYVVNAFIRTYPSAIKRECFDVDSD